MVSGLANYERECLNLSMKRLRPEVNVAVWKALKFLVNVTDLSIQIYVVEDMNNSPTVKLQDGARHVATQFSDLKYNCQSA